MAPKKAMYFQFTDPVTTLPVALPTSAVSGAVWRRSYQQHKISSAPEATCCEGSHTPLDGRLHRAHLFHKHSYAEVQKFDPIPGSANYDYRTQTTWSCDGFLNASSGPKPRHPFNDLEVEAARVESVHEAAAVRRMETGVVPGVFVGNLFVVHPRTCQEAQSHWNGHNHGDGPKQEDPRMVICPSPSSAYREVLRILDRRESAASFRTADNHATAADEARKPSKATYLAALRQDGALWLRLAADSKASQSQAPGLPRLSVQASDMDGSSTLASSSGSATRNSAQRPCQERHWWGQRVLGQLSFKRAPPRADAVARSEDLQKAQQTRASPSRSLSAATSMAASQQAGVTGMPDSPCQTATCASGIDGGPHTSPATDSSSRSTTSPAALHSSTCDIGDTDHTNSANSKQAASRRRRRVEQLTSMHQHNVASGTTVDGPSRLAMRLKAAAMWLADEADSVKNSAPARSADILLNAVLGLHEVETMTHAMAMRLLAPRLAHAGLNRSATGKSAKSEGTKSQQGTFLPPPSQPRVYGASMLSALSALEMAPESMRFTRDSPQLKLKLQTDIEEHRKAAQMLKRTRQKFRKLQHKLGKLEQELSKHGCGRSGASHDTAHDDALPQWLYDKSIRLSNFTAAEHSGIMKVLTELRRGVCSRDMTHASRGLPAFSVPGLHVGVTTPLGEVRFTPLFLERQTLQAAMAALQSYGLLTSRSARRSRRASRRKAAEERAATSCVDTLARFGIGISVGDVSSSSGGMGRQQDEDAPAEATDLLAEMGHSRAAGGPGSIAGVGAVMLGRLATTVLGGASLLTATWQAAGDCADTALYRSGLSRFVPGWEVPVQVRAHMLQDFVGDCGRWNQRLDSNTTNDEGGSLAEQQLQGKCHKPTILSAVTNATLVIKSLRTAEAKDIAHLLGAGMDESFGSALEAGQAEPSASSKSNVDQGQIQIRCNPDRVWGFALPEAAWDEGDEPDHLKGVIVVGDCSLHLPLERGAQRTIPVVAVDDACIFRAEGYMSSDDV